MEIDVSGVWYKPNLLWRSRALKQHPCVGRSGVSIFFAAHDEHWALDVANVIDRTQLRSRNTKSPLQLIQQERGQESADAAEVIFHPIAGGDLDGGIDFLKQERIDL